MTNYGKVCRRRGNNIEAPETLIRKIVRTSHLPSQITLNLCHKPSADTRPRVGFSASQ